MKRASHPRKLRTRGQRCRAKPMLVEPHARAAVGCSETGLTRSTLSASLEKIKALHEVSSPKEQSECSTNNLPLTGFTSGETFHVPFDAHGASRVRLQTCAVGPRALDRAGIASACGRQDHHRGDALRSPH